ncbi:hypothetical protein [Colwellia sp. E150_009]
MSRKDAIEKGLSKATFPVEPKVFIKKVKDYFDKKEVFVSDDLPAVLERLCLLLNYSISNPRIGGFLDQRNILIYPAQTGVGKSVSVQHYVTMLKHESSLIVVNTVEEAMAYCTNINSIREQNSYAKFFAAENKKNKNQILKNNMSELVYVQCLVITHKMFTELQSNSNKNIDVFQQHKSAQDKGGSARDLIVIDERLSFINKKSLKFDELEGIENFLADTLEYSPKFKNAPLVVQHRDSVKATIELITEKQLANKNKAAFIDQLSLEYKLENESLPARIDFEAIQNIIFDRLDEIDTQISLLKPSKIKNLGEIKNGVVATLNAFIDITLPKEKSPKETCTGLEEIYREFAIYKKDLYKVNSLHNQFGTSVVLDATAEVNNFYALTSSNSNSHIDIVEAPKIRKYKNLTIYKAQGVQQSANAIFKKGANVAKDNANWYTKVIKETLNDGDKLLVISFKGFIEEYLSKIFPEKGNVVFTNWGNHVGRNDWKDCNKVMLIGWFRLPEEEYISKLFHISSLGTSDLRVMKHITPDAVKNLQLSEVADDLIQGAMRCCARVIDTKDSDCKAASVYLFQDNFDGSDDVINLFESEFPKANIVNWIPKASRPRGTLPKPQQKQEVVIECLLKNLESNSTYLRRDLCKECSISPPTMTRWLKSGYFKDRLKKLGICLDKVDGKSEAFKFK